MPSIPQGNPVTVDLFAVSDAVWTPISKQVGLVVLANPIGSIAAVDVPDFPQLETACQLWVSTTFPGLVGLSAAIATFAAAAATRLSKLSRAVSQQTQAGAVSRATAEFVTTGFATLAKQAAPMNRQCNALYRQVQVFRTEFEIVDAEEQAADRGVQNSIDLLGPWEPLIGVLPPMEQEAGLVMGAWQAITDDFNAVTSADIESMEPFLLPLELNAAARSWTNLVPEAVGFASLAQGQEQYLSGA